MELLLKIAAISLLFFGFLVWVQGKSQTEQVSLKLPSTNLAASVGLVPGAEWGVFDATGKILIDEIREPGGTPFLLYTTNDTAGRPQIKTKRLVFSNRDRCSDLGLPCATNQPGVPVAPNEEVRVIGVVKNEIVEVSEMYRI